MSDLLFLFFIVTIVLMNRWFSQFYFFRLFFSSSLFITLFLWIFIFIRAIIFFYSKYYTGHSRFFNYYIFLLFSFIISIFFLVLSSPGLRLIIFWDLLGITRFILVIFYSNWDRNSGGLNTLLCNHLGDVFIILFFSVMIFNRSSWRMLTTPSLLFIVISAFTKSAQGPFIQWLPMAISAPTPVSSLVHSRTLVTGGLFLIYLYYWGLNNTLFFLLRTYTFFISGLVALVEKDMKKLVAMRTLSQIRFCILITLFFYFIPSFNHLLTHALFKSCLFIQIGVLIFFTLGSQESRNFIFLNGIYQLMVIINMASLCGLMYFSGIFSKDVVLLIVCGGTLNFFVFLGFFLGVSITFFYSYNLIKSLLNYRELNILNLNSFVPLILCGVAVVGGCYFQNLFFFYRRLFIERWVIWILIIFFSIFGFYYLSTRVLVYKLFLNIIFKLLKPAINNFFIFDRFLNYFFFNIIGLSGHISILHKKNLFFLFFVLIFFYLMIF